MARAKNPAPAAAPVDLLKSVTKSATKATPKGKVSLPEIKLTTNEKELVDTIRLATVSGELTPILDESKKSVNSHLLDLWVKNMWETKTVPSNFKVVVMEKDATGKDTLRKDMEATFQVKFRSDGLTKIVPDADELEEGETVEDKILEALTSDQVGLSEQNARKMMNPDSGDISVREELELADSFNSLYQGEEGPGKSGITKILKYMQARPVNRTQKTIDLPFLTDEESNALLLTRQAVKVKDGFFERAYTYCTSEAQLNKLIRFIKPTLQIGSFDFGISDKKSDRIRRLEETVSEFLSAE